MIETSMIDGCLVPEGYELRTVKKMVKANPTKLPPFRLIGKSSSNTSIKEKPLNLVKEMANMSKQELYVMEVIEERLDFDTNEAYIGAVDKAEGIDSSKFKRGYQKLKTKELLIRLPKGYYLVNPGLIIPSSNYANVLNKFKVAIASK